MDDAQGYFLSKLEKNNPTGYDQEGQGSGKPRFLNQNDEKSVCQKALIAPSNQPCKVQPRGSNIKKR